MAQPWIVDPASGEEPIGEVLREFGFAIVPGALDAGSLDQLRGELDPHFAQAEFCEGLFYGKRTRRFGRVLARSRAAQALALHPLALGPARNLLGPQCEDIQLNLTQAIEIWPGSLVQAPHRDQDIWLGAEQSGEMMLNCMWAIDDFTRDNGATMVWPGTHGKRGIVIPESDGVAAVMPAGSLCLFTGSVIHGGGGNWSEAPRRGLVMSYCLGWLKPCENPFLSYPPEIARHFAPELARLIGYRQDAPSLNNVDGRCPSELLQPGAGPRGFADRLTEEQAMMIEQYNEMQIACRPIAA